LFKRIFPGGGRIYQISTLFGAVWQHVPLFLFDFLHFFGPFGLNAGAKVVLIYIKTKSFGAENAFNQRISTIYF